MPALDGYALARKVRSEIGLLPRLVALTACTTASDEQEGYRAGFDAYCRKPVDWQQLEALLVSFQSLSFASPVSCAGGETG
jgi:CheY-like chemotaxis protein